MRKTFFGLITALALLPTSMTAQEKDINAYVQADLVSHYMWRGQDLAGISIQPQIGIEWKGLSLTASGNAGFDNNDTQEIDLNVNYEKWGFNIGVTDYWQTGTDPDNRYFFFSPKKGAHQFEGNIGYTCKYGSLQAYTVFAGNDFKTNGDRAFSTYIELSVPFRLGGLDWDARAGVTPMESAGYTERVWFEAGGAQHYVDQNHYAYGEGFTCNMASLRATKTLEYKNVEIPVFAEMHTNPYLQTATFIVGIGIKAF